MPDKASKGMKLHSTNRSLRSSGKGGVTELEFLKMTKIRKSFLLHATATSFALRGRFHQHFRPTFSRKLVGKLFRRLVVNFINTLRAYFLNESALCSVSLVTFWQKTLSYKKRACEMLMKLTTGNGEEICPMAQ